jgi:hypothetical protein
MSCYRSVAPTIGTLESLIMHCLLFDVLSIGNGVWIAGVSFCLYTGTSGWAEHGFGIVSVSESVPVIRVLDAGSKTMVGFAMKDFSTWEEEQIWSRCCVSGLGQNDRASLYMST